MTNPSVGVIFLLSLEINSGRMYNTICDKTLRSWYGSSHNRTVSGLRSFFMLIKLTVYQKNGKTVHYRATDKINRISRRISREDFTKCHIRISYGTFPNYKNKPTEFFNEGYALPTEAKELLNYFWQG